MGYAATHDELESMAKQLDNSTTGIASRMFGIASLSLLTVVKITPLYIDLLMVMAKAEVGGAEVNLAVLAATLVDVVDFFPVTFLYGVSKFLFSALALAFCLSLLASFVVAMTVIPLFCSRFLKAVTCQRTRTEE